MKLKRIKKQLIRSWLGTIFLHVLLLPPWAIYLVVKPIHQWSIVDIPIALFVVISGYIVLFWTLYLWGVGSHTIKRILLKYGLPLHRIGQVCTILLLVFMVTKAISDLVLNSDVLGEPFTLGYWGFFLVAEAQGIQHYLYKITSASPKGKDGLVEMLERKQPVSWYSPVGGSIGVQLRRLKQEARTGLGKLQREHNQIR
jgi:hypothetical protein